LPLVNDLLHTCIWLSFLEDHMIKSMTTPEHAFCYKIFVFHVWGHTGFRMLCQQFWWIFIRFIHLSWAYPVIFCQHSDWWDSGDLKYVTNCQKGKSHDTSIKYYISWMKKNTEIRGLEDFTTKLDMWTYLCIIINFFLTASSFMLVKCCSCL
jgi:hypothetical protein